LAYRTIAAWQRRSHSPAYILSYKSVWERCGEKGKRMIRISVEVSSGAARFRVMVQAESIERALEIAKRHNSGKECRVTFPAVATPPLTKKASGLRGKVGKVAA